MLASTDDGVLVRHGRAVKQTIGNYALAAMAVSAAFGARMILEPVTGTGAPYVLFFGAIVATGLWVGAGPGILATMLSAVLGAYAFIVRAGFSPGQAVTQAALFVVDGMIVIYLSFLMRRARGRAQASEAHYRDFIELAPDAFFLADLDGRFSDVNQSACRMLGFAREDLIGKAITDIIPVEDRPRLFRTRDTLLRPGQVHRGEWQLLRKDGRAIPVEVHSNVLPGGRWQAFIRDITERKRIEDERRVFVSLLDNSPDFVGIADPSGKPIYLNPAGRRMVGLPPEFVVQDTQMIDYYPADQRAFAADEILRAMTERGRWSGETYFRHWRTEEPIPVSDEHFMIFEPGSKRVLGMGTVTRDITEARRAAHEREELLARERVAREQAEQTNAELRESEERFRLMFEEAPIGMALVALDGHFVRVNAALCEIVGYSARELEQVKFQDITHPDDRRSDLTVLHRLVHGEIPRYQFEKRYIRKDGRVVPILLSVSVLRSPSGEPQYFVSQMEDVAERKRVEEDHRFLAEAGAVLAGSLDYEETLSTLGGLMVRDFADWCIIDVVEAAQRPRRLKVTAARPDHAPICAEFEQLQLDRSLPHLAAPVLHTGRPYLIEKMTPEQLRTYTQSDEHWRLLHAMEPRSVMGVPMLLRGNLMGILVLMSSSRAFEPADLRLATALGERAALAIENGRLYQTALQATQFRDEILGVVAHDLRNPVAAIMMQASALKRTGGHPERRNQKKTDSIIRSAQRMNRLIGDLLDVTLIESGQLGVQQERLSVHHLLLESIEAQRPLAASGSIGIEVSIADELPPVWGDQHRLMQVLQNLIGNAIKFTPPDGRIAIGAAPRTDEVLFWVADTGCGISAEGLPHVFDRFWQERKGAHQGAGLGLPITRGIVEAHGGRIWVESTPGRGSVFFFTIPAAVHVGAQPDLVAHSPGA
jgi:PAS domain S-box-containing protein